MGVFPEMNNWVDLLFNGGGIASGIIAGIVAAFVQLLISHFDHDFLTKMKKKEQVHQFIEWQRDEIGKLIEEVSAIRVPAITETNEDVIENAFHLIVADFERAKPLLYEKNDPVLIKGFFNTLHNRHNQMQAIQLGLEKELCLEDAKRVLIMEIQECKQRLLNALQSKEKEILSIMI